MFFSLGQGVATANAGYQAVQAGGPPAPAPAPRVVRQVAPRVAPVVRRERVVVKRHHHEREQPVHIWFHKRNHNRNFNDIYPSNNSNTNFNRSDREHDHRDGRPTIIERDDRD